MLIGSVCVCVIIIDYCETIIFFWIFVNIVHNMFIKKLDF